VPEAYTVSKLIFWPLYVTEAYTVSKLIFWPFYVPEAYTVSKLIFWPLYVPEAYTVSKLIFWPLYVLEAYTVSKLIFWPLYVTEAYTVSKLIFWPLYVPEAYTVSKLIFWPLYVPEAYLHAYCVALLLVKLSSQSRHLFLQHPLTDLKLLCLSCCNSQCPLLLNSETPQLNHLGFIGLQLWQLRRKELNEKSSDLEETMNEWHGTDNRKYLEGNFFRPIFEPW